MTGAPYCLEARAYDAIERLMVAQRPSCPGDSKEMVERSFGGQIRQELGDLEPDALLVTAYSAIPVVDTIRGYYEALARPVPYIDYIRADTQASRYTDVGERVRKEEIARLGPKLGGMSCIVVIDQYVNRGRTLQFARGIVRDILRATNTRHPYIGDFRGSNWYREALKSEIDIERLTSVHSQKMYAIGVQAAQFEPDWDIVASPAVLRYTGKLIG